MMIRLRFRRTETLAWSGADPFTIDYPPDAEATFELVSAQRVQNDTCTMLQLHDAESGPVRVFLEDAGAAFNPLIVRIWSAP